MSEIVETVETAGYEIRIDAYGGAMFYKHGERQLDLGPSFMAEVVTAYREATNPTETDATEEPDPEAPGFEMSDFRYTANHGTTGLAPLDVLQRGYQRGNRDTAAALFSTDLLRETLEVAEAIGDADAMWVVVSQDAPMAFVPEGETLGAVIAPRVKPGNEPNPFGEEAETDE